MYIYPLLLPRTSKLFKGLLFISLHRMMELMKVCTSELGQVSLSH